MRFVQSLSLRSKVGRGVAIAVGVGALVAVGAPFASGANGNNLGPVAQAGTDSVLAKGVFWAVIDPDGSFVRGKGVVSSENVGTGAYIVHFNRNMRNCSYVGTIGLSGASGTSAPGFITTVGAAVDVNGVFVTTDDSGGTSTNLGFHLHVNC